MWEWCRIDENNIKTAIEMQNEEGLIDLKTKEKMLAFMEDLSKQSEQAI